MAPSSSLTVSSCREENPKHLPVLTAVEGLTSLLLGVTTQLKVLAALDGLQRLVLALGAFQLQDDLFFLSF